MYNRYVPQGDGSFRRQVLPEPDPGEGPQSSPAPAFQPIRQRLDSSAGGFLKGLLPEGLDTEDLIVILLLLLLSGEKDSSTAMLTLGAYLFL